MDLEAEIDRLYALPLGEFVAARNALAKALSARGERERADDVKSRAKPNLPAWAVNQLWHRERKAFDRLLEGGAAVRAAVAGKSTGGARATAEKREAAKALVALAKDLLRAAGQPSTSSTQQKISHTVDAVAALGAERLDPPLGRLTRDLEPQGFGVLAGLQVAPPKSAPKTAPKKRKKPAATPGRTRPRGKAAPGPSRSAAAAAAAAEKAERERRLRVARRELDDKLAAFGAAQEEAERTAGALAEARRQAATAAKAARRAEKEAQEAARRSVAAEEAATAAAQSANTAASAARAAGAAVKAARRRLAKTGG